MTPRQKRIYMRKYMRKYYKRNRKKILARSKVLRMRRLRARKLTIRREKTKDAAPTFQADKVNSKRLFREKLYNPPSENQIIPVPKIPWSPICPNCGMLQLDPNIPCQHCGPGRENKHRPPSPRPAMVRIEQEDQPIDEEGLA